MITTQPYLLIFGQDLVYWSGMIAGALFLVVILSACIKQFNLKGWIKYQIPMTKHHHTFGWLSITVMIIHLILAILEFNLHIFL